MSFSTYLGNTVIDHLLRAQAFTSPSLIYVSLHSADPGVDWTGASEISGSSYVRQVLWFSAATAKTTTNASALSFSGMPASNVTHAGVFNFSTGGSMLMSGSLSASKVVNGGDTFQFALSDFDVVLT